MHRLEPEHLKRYDEDYTHICVDTFEGGHEDLFCNLTFKLPEEHTKNSESWITSKPTKHIKIFHPSLNSGKLYTEMHSRNAGKSMSAMFTTSVG